MSMERLVGVWSEAHLEICLALALGHSNVAGDERLGLRSHQRAASMSAALHIALAVNHVRR